MLHTFLDLAAGLASPLSYLVLSPVVKSFFGVSVVFCALVAIRLTVPRIKLESVSRLGWIIMFGVVLLSYTTASLVLYML